MNLVTNAAREAEVSTPASPHSRELVTISKEELESIRRLMAQLEGPTTTSTSTFAHSGTSASAYNASLTSFSPSWIIDSGATDHMTGMSSMFSSKNFLLVETKLGLMMDPFLLYRERALLPLMSLHLFH